MGGPGGLPGSHLCTSPTHLPLQFLVLATRRFKSQVIVLSLSLLFVKWRQHVHLLGVILRLRDNVGIAPDL